jgi:hypothetical protein
MLIRDNRKIRRENKELKENQKRSIWLPKDDKELMTLMKDIEGYKIKELNDLEEFVKKYPSKNHAFGPVTISKAQEERNEKEKHIAELLYPLKNDIIIFVQTVNNLIGYQFATDLIDFIKAGNTNIKFIFQLPESVLASYELQKSSKKGSRLRAFEALDPLYRTKKIPYYTKTHNIFESILWLKDHLIGYENLVYFCDSSTDIEFLKIDNKFVHRLSNQSDWEYTDDFTSLSLAKSSHSEMIESIINHKFLLPFNDYNLSAYWEKLISFLLNKGD